MKTNETDLPAQQNSTQTQIRFSRPHENDQWTQNNQPSSPRRSQRSCSRLTFSNKDRLLKRYEFKRVSREGKRLVGQRLCIDYTRTSRLRLGITASTKYGDAPE